MSNKDVQDKLRSHLPNDWTLPTSENECRELIQSSQYQQALNAFRFDFVFAKIGKNKKEIFSFSTTFQSGQLGSVLTQFNFPDEILQAANQGDLKAFEQALEKHYQSQKDKSSNNTMDTS